RNSAMPDTNKLPVQTFGGRPDLNIDKRTGGRLEAHLTPAMSGNVRGGGCGCDSAPICAASTCAASPATCTATTCWRWTFRNNYGACNRGVIKLKRCQILARRRSNSCSAKEHESDASDHDSLLKRKVEIRGSRYHTN